jgi:Endonuclease/Exonuclease/phosphatase family
LVSLDATAQEASMHRRAFLRTLASALVLTSLGSSFAHAKPEGVTLRVLTRNVYYGADLNPAVAAILSGDPEAVVAAVTGLWAQVQATDYRTRARGLAAEIEHTLPDLIGLQEAALWRTQSPSDAFTESPTPATHVALDLVEILLDELAERGLSYEVVASSEGLDAELPMVGESSGLSDLRFTDRDVILARRHAPGLVVSNAQGGNFETNLVLPNGLPVLMSWLSVDVRRRGEKVRFVSAHLADSPLGVREAQAMELLDGPAETSVPVILVGDLNSDADLPEAEDAYAVLLDGGFQDAWTEVHGVVPGPTALFDANVSDLDAALTERRDLVLWRGDIEPTEAEILGDSPSDRVDGLWPSDHAGVSATFRLR